MAKRGYVSNTVLMDIKRARRALAEPGAARRAMVKIRGKAWVTAKISETDTRIRKHTKAENALRRDYGLPPLCSPPIRVGRYKRERQTIKGHTRGCPVV